MQWVIVRRTPSGQLRFIADSFLGKNSRAQQVWVGVEWTRNAADALRYSRLNADDLAAQYKGTVVSAAEALQLR